MSSTDDPRESYFKEESTMSISRFYHFTRNDNSEEIEKLYNEIEERNKEIKEAKNDVLKDSDKEANEKISLFEKVKINLEKLTSKVQDGIIENVQKAMNDGNLERDQTRPVRFYAFTRKTNSLEELKDSEGRPIGTPSSLRDANNEIFWRSLIVSKLIREKSILTIQTVVDNEENNHVNRSREALQDNYLINKKTQIVKNATISHNGSEAENLESKLDEANEETRLEKQRETKENTENFDENLVKYTKKKDKKTKKKVVLSENKDIERTNQIKQNKSDSFEPHYKPFKNDSESNIESEIQKLIQFNKSMEIFASQLEQKQKQSEGLNEEGDTIPLEHPSEEKIKESVKAKRKKRVKKSERKNLAEKSSIDENIDDASAESNKENRNKEGTSFNSSHEKEIAINEENPYLKEQKNREYNSLTKNIEIREEENTKENENELNARPKRKNKIKKEKTKINEKNEFSLNSNEITKLSKEEKGEEITLKNIEDNKIEAEKDDSQSKIISVIKKKSEEKENESKDAQNQVVVENSENNRKKTEVEKYDELYTVNLRDGKIKLELMEPESIDKESLANHQASIKSKKGKKKKEKVSQTETNDEPKIDESKLKKVNFVGKSESSEDQIQSNNQVIYQSANHIDENNSNPETGSKKKNHKKSSENMDKTNTKELADTRSRQKSKKNKLANDFLDSSIAMVQSEYFEEPKDSNSSHHQNNFQNSTINLSVSNYFTDGSSSALFKHSTPMSRTQTASYGTKLRSHSLNVKHQSTKTKKDPKFTEDDLQDKILKDRSLNLIRPMTSKVSFMEDVIKDRAQTGKPNGKTGMQVFKNFLKREELIRQQKILSKINIPQDDSSKTNYNGFLPFIPKTNSQAIKQKASASSQVNKEIFYSTACKLNEDNHNKFDEISFSRFYEPSYSIVSYDHVEKSSHKWNS